jgi:PPK2 family polyphosphate:nucleotide phosphotransferase
MHFADVFAVKPGSRPHLDRIDPSYKGEHETAEAAKVEIEHYRATLARQQALLYAERKHSLLIVLQALDAGGKDGTVGHVFTALNPQGTTVTCFKEPTPAEQAHDFLWRVHPHAPGRGEVAIFNRSHYEDVLVPRVHRRIDKEAWTDRFERIREFEAGLADNGTLVLKFFLHIGKDEQLARFGERLADPERNWKISEADYTERELWDAYIAAYEDAIAATSTHTAPWYVVPANHKWFRNLAVSQIVAHKLEALGMAFPAPSVDLAEIRRRYHAAEREARQGPPPAAQPRKAK